MGCGLADPRAFHTKHPQLQLTHSIETTIAETGCDKEEATGVHPRQHRDVVRQVGQRTNRGKWPSFQRVPPVQINKRIQDDDRATGDAASKNIHSSGLLWH